MKIKDVKKTPQVLQENLDNEEDVRRPLGISRSDFTEEFKDYLRKMRRNQPLLYQKIMAGD